MATFYSHQRFRIVFSSLSQILDFYNGMFTCYEFGCLQTIPQKASIGESCGLFFRMKRRKPMIDGLLMHIGILGLVFEFFFSKHWFLVVLKKRQSCWCYRLMTWYVGSICWEKMYANVDVLVSNKFFSPFQFGQGRREHKKNLFNTSR